MFSLRSFVLFSITSSLVACGSTAEPTPSGSSPVPETTPPGTEEEPPGKCPAGEGFESKSGKVIVRAQVNGAAPRNWLLDTGAPTSVADKSLAAEIGEGKDVTITVAGVTKTIHQLYASDLREQGRLDVAGVLGQDVFGDVLTLDYPRQRFWITSDMADRDLRACTHVRATPVVVDAKNQAYVYVRGSAEGMPGWFLVDSGASLNAMPNKIFDELTAAHPRPALQGFYTPAAIGTFWARLTTVAWLEVGGFKVENIVTRTMDDDLVPPPGRIGDEKFLGVLPSGWLTHFMMTIDFKAQKVRFDAKKEGVLRDPTKMYSVGIGLEPTTEIVRVAHVLPGSSAEEAGIKAGDEIVRIGSTATKTMDPYARAFYLVGREDGIKVNVTITRDGIEKDFALVTRDVLTPPKL
jgi:predicted aspartyl protease